MTPADLVPAATAPDLEAEVARLRQENADLRAEIRVAHEAAEITAQLVHQQFEQTEDALQRLRQTSSQLQAVLNAASEVSIVACDVDGTIRLFSRGAEHLLGCSAEEVVGRRSILAFHQMVELREAAWVVSGEEPPEHELGQVFEWYVNHGLTEMREWTYVRRDGTAFPVNLSITPLPDAEGNLGGFLNVAIDISPRKALEAKLEHQANHDPLTGLLNRRPFEENLAREIARAERDANRFSMLMFDIDCFKGINDTYGHSIGDDILIAVSEMTGQQLRAADMLARWGGEEFIALLPQTRQEGAATLAERIRAIVATTHFPGPGEVTISVGVTQYQAGETGSETIKRLDDALYTAKESGRNRVVEG